ncbi:MAG: small multi-drug export protein [Patescibacteria group bacterium]|nr:small multi-drug export protein [Patescibacteria group bacterium]
MFSIEWASLFSSLPGEISTLLVAMIPIAELRVALPMALGPYKLPLFEAFIWSFIGNMIPVFFILWFLEPVSRFLMKKSRFFNKFFNWLFDRTRRKFTKNTERYGVVIALILFVAIPLPVTGAWTGSVAAFLFAVSYKKAILSIALGVLIASFVVGSLYFGAISLF